ncbi:MAG: S9 family peptidase [Flavobacteriales bacterium]|nr:S9 family peptidase [Flavobacteriales bacterium]MCB9197478.1 S9 family peptidase [Flavobacteriales bacterium]
MRRISTLLLGIFLLGGVIAQGTKTIDNHTIWGTRTFSASNVYGVESMNDGIHFTRLTYTKEGTAIEKFTYETYKSVGVIVDSKDLVYNGKSVNIDDYDFNFNETKILIASDQESIYRHSSNSYYFIYDIATKRLEPLADLSKSKQRLAAFSPSGELIAFMRDNNLFYRSINDNTEIQITNDGSENNIVNGGTDWVYEEEFSFDRGFYWSPNSDRIAYYRFDESGVREFQMDMYGTLYPEHYKFKYPKAGEANSVVSIHVYDLSSRRTDDFNLGENTDIYVPRITWSNDKYTLLVQRLNRLQNKLEILTGSYQPGRQMNVPVPVKVVYTEESKTYIDIHDNTQMLSDGKTILWTSEIDGFNHIYLIDVTTGKTTQITKGNWEVTSVYGLDELTGKIYFQAAKEHPTQREVYAVMKDGSNLIKLSSKPGTNEAEFSSNFKYFLLYHSDANTPFTVSIIANHKKSKLKTPLIIEDNAALLKRMSEYNLSQKTFFTVKNAEGTDLNAWMIKPSDFDENKKYPLLMFVYGGPGINTVNDEWSYGNYFWFQSLAQQGYIVVSVDARGTGYRGKDFKHCTYLQLGKFETEDQIAAAKVLGKYDYIDENRIGIFGWSYGGYMSSLCITKGADVFKTAIAVAPVTNWRYYDNVYTERFMRTPQENGENYDVNSPINHVDKLKGNYLLIHGSADDNVHFQNSMEMVDALVNANKQFDFMAYPNKNHGIYGGNTREHLYDLMTNYLLENL